MKKFLYLLLAIVTLATFGCTGDSSTFMSSVGTPNPNKFQPKGTVSGVLVDVCTNSPISNADVYILDKKATTSTQGMFTIKNVPANTAVGNEPDNTALGLPLGSGTSLLSNGLNSWDTYNVVIDMARVNKEIADYNANPKNTVKKAFYPAFAYHTVKVSYTSLGETLTQVAGATNHDTPVDGFVANIKPMVGKLAANLNIQVVKDTDAVPVGTGCVVELISISPLDGFADSNNATGNLANVIATANTDGSGIAKFTNIESAHLYYAKATITIANKVYTGHQLVFTQCDGTTTNFYLVGPNPAMIVKDSSDNRDFVKPFATSVTPVNLADIAPSDTTNVVFTFSEVLKPTQYLLNTTPETAAVDGVYKDIIVNYLGPKAGNIPYTMAWDSVTAPKVLTVTFATSKSSKFTVDMSVAIPKLQDLNGNSGDATIGTPVTTFTTSGGLAVTSPTIVRSLTSETTVNWLPQTNAYAYRIYIARNVDGVTGSYVFAGQTPFSTFDISTSAVFAAGPPAGIYAGPATPGSAIPFNDGETKLSYNVYVVTINTDGTESTPISNIATIDDRTKPTASVTSGRPTAPIAAATTVEGDMIVPFSEVMDKPSVLDPTKWGLQFIGAVTPNVTVTMGPITVAYAGVSPNIHTVATVHYKIVTDATGTVGAGAINVTCTATDLNGNAVVSPF